MMGPVLLDAAIRLVVRIALAAGLGALLGALWGVLVEDDVHQGLTVGLYVAGTVTLVLGVMGVSSPSRRDSMAASWQEKWASRSAFARNRESRDDARVSDTVVLVLAALVLFALGALSESL
jgi:hypothetical protein